MWIEMTVLIPLICLFEPIFALLQVEPDVAHIAGKYMQYAALGVPVSSNAFMTLRKVWRLGTDRV